MPVKKSRPVPAETLVSLTPIHSENAFYNVPSSPATSFMFEFMSAGANIMGLPQQKKQINHNTDIQIAGNGNSRKITSITPKHSITLDIADIDKFTGSNKPAKKFFVFSLIKANEQAIFNGELGREYITFHLSELLDNGFYKTIQSARNGFKAAFDALTDIKVSGDIQVSKKNKISVIGVHPFRKAIIKNNQCYVYLENSFDWRFMSMFFTILPRYYFKLSNRASDLLYYIFYIARQNTQNIKDRGYFTISLRAIHNLLQLPAENGLNNPQRDIRKPIEDAIEQIETNHSLYYGNTDFSILPVNDDATNISDYLNNGYLKIELRGSFAKQFTNISQRTENKLKDQQRRKEKIAEKAQTINLVNKLNQEHSTGEKEHSTGEKEHSTGEKEHSTGEKK